MNVGYIGTTSVIPCRLIVRFRLIDRKIVEALPIPTWLSREPVLVVPRSSVRPRPPQLSAQPEPSPVRQICHKLILLRAVDRGQISLLRQAIIPGLTPDFLFLHKFVAIFPKLRPASWTGDACRRWSPISSRCCSRCCCSL